MRRDPLVLVLLAGWLLMSPPLVKDDKAPGGYRVDLNAGVESWQQLSAHDTATDCERAKSEKALAALSAAEDRKAGKKNLLDEPIVDAATHALCVPADYIYGPTASGECVAPQQSL